MRSRTPPPHRVHMKARRCTMALYLGLDCSTQGLKAVVIDSERRILLQEAVNFDKDLGSKYKTEGGTKRTYFNEDEPLYVAAGGDSKAASDVSAAVGEKRRREEEPVLHPPQDTAASLVYTAPSAMFLAALDLLLARIKARDATIFPRIAAISASGQQHGSVWWRRKARDALGKLDPARSLEEQLGRAFSLPNGPIWMDSSTHAECARLERAVGGPQKLADICGSRAYERFTGNQISKIKRLLPHVYDETERISLVSSLVSCVLLGAYAPIDASDGGGMNLLDMRTRAWSTPLLNATAAAATTDVDAASLDAEKSATTTTTKDSSSRSSSSSSNGSEASGNESKCGSSSSSSSSTSSSSNHSSSCESPSSSASVLSAAGAELRAKLGENVAASDAVLGHVSDYFVARWGFSRGARVVAASGDNPCTLAGMQLAKPGDVGVSLGTSDTLFAVVASAQARPSGSEGVVLPGPTDNARSAMLMLCFKNGSVTREKIRNETVGSDWAAFDAALAATKPGNGGETGMFWLEPEITPTVNCARRAVVLFDAQGHKTDTLASPAHTLRACIESQVLNMRHYSAALGLDKPKRIVAAGGAAANKHILQIVADVFRAPVYTQFLVNDAKPEESHGVMTNTAALGAAFRALDAYDADATAAAAAAAGAGGAPAAAATDAASGGAHNRDEGRQEAKDSSAVSSSSSSSSSASSAAAAPLLRVVEQLVVEPQFQSSGAATAAAAAAGGRSEGDSDPYAGLLRRFGALQQQAIELATQSSST